MSKALKVAAIQRLVGNCAKNSKKPNNSVQIGLGIGEPASAVFRPPEALNRPVSEDFLAKARQAKEKLIEQGRSLKQDWLDADHWRALAAKRQYRLPHWYIPLSAGGIETVLRDLGLGSKFFRDVFGEKETYKRFIKRNPQMPLWAFVGICLELVQADIIYNYSY
jgi:hypothetical protein